MRRMPRSLSALMACFRWIQEAVVVPPESRTGVVSRDPCTTTTTTTRRSSPSRSWHFIRGTDGRCDPAPRSRRATSFARTWPCTQRPCSRRITTRATTRAEACGAAMTVCAPIPRRSRRRKSPGSSGAWPSCRVGTHRAGLPTSTTPRATGPVPATRLGVARRAPAVNGAMKAGPSPAVHGLGLEAHAPRDALRERRLIWAADSSRDRLDDLRIAAFPAGLRW